MKENTAGMNSACRPRNIAIEKIIVHDTHDGVIFNGSCSDYMNWGRKKALP